MEKFVDVALHEIKTELGEDTVNTVRDPSSCVRCFLIKYKCYLIFSLTFLASLMLLYTTVIELMSDDKSSKLMAHMFTFITQTYFPNVTALVPEAFSENINKDN